MIVFAVTRGRARSRAFYMDEFEGAEWTELRVVRAPEFDKYWSSDHLDKAYMDWYDAEDRIALVKAGWSCMEPIPEDCTRCPAAEWCSEYQMEAQG